MTSLIWLHQALLRQTSSATRSLGRLVEQEENEQRGGRVRGSLASERRKAGSTARGVRWQSAGHVLTKRGGEGRQELLRQAQEAAANNNVEAVQACMCLLCMQPYLPFGFASARLCTSLALRPSPRPLASSVPAVRQAQVL